MSIGGIVTIYIGMMVGHVISAALGIPGSVHTAFSQTVMLIAILFCSWIERAVRVTNGRGR